MTEGFGFWVFKQRNKRMEDGRGGRWRARSPNQYFCFFHYYHSYQKKIVIIIILYVFIFYLIVTLKNIKHVAHVAHNSLIGLRIGTSSSFLISLPFLSFGLEHSTRMYPHTNSFTLQTPHHSVQVFVHPSLIPPT